MQHDALTLSGQIVQPAVVMAVDVFRGLSAVGTQRRCLAWAGHDGNLVSAGQHVIDHQASRDQRQDVFGQKRLSIGGGTPYVIIQPQNVGSAACKVRENPNFADFRHAILTSLREDGSLNLQRYCDVVSDNFRIIPPEDFRILT